MNKRPRTSHGEEEAERPTAAAAKAAFVLGRPDLLACVIDHLTADVSVLSSFRRIHTLAMAVPAAARVLLLRERAGNGKIARVRVLMRASAAFLSESESSGECTDKDLARAVLRNKEKRNDQVLKDIVRAGGVQVLGDAVEMLARADDVEAMERVLALQLDGLPLDSVMGVACASRSFKVMLRLLQLPASCGIDAGMTVNGMHQMPLLCACFSGNTEMLQLLLDLPPERGVEPNAGLSLAISRNQTEIVRMLLELPIERGVDPSDELLHAISMHHTDIVLLLLRLPVERGVRPGAHNQEAFIAACDVNDPIVLRELLDLPPERGVDPSAQDNIGFLYLCGHANSESVRMLLAEPPERGIRADAQDSRAIDFAVARNQPETLRFLLDLPAEYKIDAAAGDERAIKLAEEMEMTKLAAIIRAHLAQQQQQQQQQ